MKINLIYLAGLLSAFHSPTGHPVIELIIPPLLLYTIFINPKNKGFSFKKDTLLLFFLILTICFVFTIFFIQNGQAENISTKYPGIYSSFVYQSLRMLLFPMAFMAGNKFASKYNFSSYIYGLSTGLLISIASGLFIILFKYKVTGFRLGVLGFSGEPRHLGQLISTTFLIFLAAKHSLKVKETIISKIFPFFLPLTFSFTGIMTLIAPTTVFFSIKQLGNLFKLRLNRLFSFYAFLTVIFTSMIFISVDKLLNLRQIPLYLLEESNIFSFVDYCLAKDTVPLRYMLKSPLSFIFGAGPSGLQIQFIETKLSLIHDSMLSGVAIFKGYWNSEILESILVPSSALIYIISVVGIIPVILIFRQLKSSLIVKYYSRSLVSSVAFYMSLLSLTLFAHSSKFLIALFALALSSFEDDNFTFNQTKRIISNDEK